MPIKVLVVDDSIVVRRLITTTLKDDPEIEVVGSASNGKLAIESAEKFEPDVITLDIEMPEMNGLEALEILRQKSPKSKVIMCSTLTAHGADATLTALANGAADYVTKPANVGSVQESVKMFQEELVPRIKALAGARRSFPTRPTSTTETTPGTNATGVAGTKRLAGGSAQPMAPGGSFQPGTVFKHNGASRPSMQPTQVDAVMIGVSTGGPAALGVLMPMIPKNINVPICIVQHMPPIFTRLLGERLNENSEIEIVEGAEGMALEAGKAIIAPGDFHMTFRKIGGRQVVQLNQQEKENSCRPAVDVMFRSAAKQFGGNVLTVVLTGMGQDGLLGADELRACGSYVLAQDQQSSVVWGMPGAIAAANLADEVLPIDQIAGRIATLTHTPVGSRVANGVNA